MATQIKLRRDTAANWLLEDPVLGQGEPGFETNTGKLKIGDGVSLWSALDYIVAEADGSIDLGAVDKHILPATDNTYNLGSPTKRWNDAFLANNSVYIGDIKLSNSSGTLVVQQVTNAGDITEAPVANPGVVTTDRIINGEHEFSINASGVLQLDGAPYTGSGTELPTNTLGYLYNDGTGTLSWTSGAGGGSGGSANLGDITVENNNTLTIENSTLGLRSFNTGGSEAKIELDAYRIRSEVSLSNSRNYNTGNGFDSAEWVAGEGSTITFTNLQQYVKDFLNTDLGNANNITVQINGSGSEYTYSYFNGTDQIYIATNPETSPVTVTEIRFSYKNTSYINIDPDESDLDIVSAPGVDIRITAGDDLRMIANDQLDITGDQVRLRSGTEFVEVITNYNVPNATPQTWQFDNGGDLTLPQGGTITEGIITSNPTIQLTPATPTVASQKLVIKGGTSYSVTNNGIELDYNNNTAIVGDALEFYIYNAITYANQTLYWWIYPEAAGIATPSSGTVELDVNGNSGPITFVVDSDDYEFTVRVSPENNNYDPASVGVESYLINEAAPTFDGDHHLHLTTGDLSVTSIILGTDNHNVRTTVNGSIEITTPGQSTNVWTFTAPGDLTLPGSSNGRIADDEPGVIVYSDNGFAVQTSAATSVSNYQVEFVGFISNGFGDASGATLTVTGVIAGAITDGMTIYGGGLPEEGWTLTFGTVMEPQGSGGVGNYYLSGANYLTASQSFNNGVAAVNGPKNWIFDTNGDLTLPGGQLIGGDDSTRGIAMTTDRGTILFGNVPEVGPTESSHFHIMKDDGANTDLFFGDDYNYVKLPGDLVEPYGVEIGTGGSNVWRFGTDGVLTIPDGGIVGGPVGTNKIDLSWDLSIISGKTIKINPGSSGVVSPTFWSFGSEASGGGVVFPAGSSIDDRLDGVTIVGAGQTAVNRFYAKVSNTLYETVDEGVTYQLANEGGLWGIVVLGQDNPRYRSADLVTWTDYGGGLPAPTGVVSTRGTTLTVDTNTWAFGGDGSLTFSDATIQTTAYPGVLTPADGDTVSGNANMVFYAGTDWYNTSRVTINPITSMLTLNGNSGTGGITFPDSTVQTTAYTGVPTATDVGLGNVTNESKSTMFTSPTFTGSTTATAATATATSTASSLGYLGLPQSATSTTATLAIGDTGKHIYVTTAGQTITIPANASVAYPIGSTITFIAGASATTVSIAIATDTMRLAGGALTGTRTLAANGMATAVKVASTLWYINGTGLT